MILGLMFGGILLGWFYFSDKAETKALRLVGRMGQAGTALLLTSMGIWLGGNEDFWHNLGEIGLHGLLFALLAVAGSIALVVPFCRIAFQKENLEKETFEKEMFQTKDAEER